MPHIASYLGLVHRAEATLADSFLTVGNGHSQEADVYHMCYTLAQMSREHEKQLTPVVERYGEVGAGDDVDEPDRLHDQGVGDVRSGGVGLLRDLQDLHLLATLVQTSWTVINQAAQGARDRELLSIAQHCASETSRQLTWLNTRMKAAAPQALLASP